MQKDNDPLGCICPEKQFLELSCRARFLWAKSDYGLNRAWLPLFIHMVDSACVASLLWNKWVPRSTRDVIASSLGGETKACALLVFLAAVHDIGKATPQFQAKPLSWSMEGDMASLDWLPESAGLPFSFGSRMKGAPHHSVAGQAILERALLKWSEYFAAPEEGGARRLRLNDYRSISSIVGCHHGACSRVKDIRDAGLVYGRAMGFDSAEWVQVQDELVDFSLVLAGLKREDLLATAEARVPSQIASLLVGILIMCDWIASDADAFALVALPSWGCKRVYFMPNDDEVCESIDMYVNADGNVRMDRLRARVQRGWNAIDLLPSWSERPLSQEQVKQLYRQRFSFPEGASPRSVQKEALKVAESLKEPGLMVIEAPMGEGKTEAALAVAEVFAAKTGAGGVCVALPTMATTDAMFSRVKRWLERVPLDEGGDARSVFLAHGKARLNEEYQGIVEDGCCAAAGEGPDIIVSEWMRGRKRGMLANFVVCTVDQVLMGALQMKHLSLRQLSLANKVVIIDECHAYDMYMRQYLNRVLGWLGSWHTPVVLLSATLPQAQKEQMLKSYQAGWCAKRVTPRPIRKMASRTNASVSSAQAQTAQSQAIGAAASFRPAYPLLSYTRGDVVEVRPVAPSARTSRVDLSLIDDDLDCLVALLKSALHDGGCVGVVCDTVSRAQEAAEVLSEVFGNDAVTLTHSRFTDIDRIENEARLLSLLGPDATRESGKRPGLHVVVGTQVLEQSLDIDFDMLVTDAAPVDLLFQRMGRCHRHVRSHRPVRLDSPQCFVRGIKAWVDGVPAFVGSIERVYDRATLMEALAVTGLTEDGSKSVLDLPSDIAQLVQDAYGDGVRSFIPASWKELYRLACEKREDGQDVKKARAHGCLLKDVESLIRGGETLAEWYSLSKTDRLDDDYGPRAVRDTQETVEVMLLRLKGGRIYLLPWIGSSEHGVEMGAEVPIDEVPPSQVAKLALQSSVRLPLSICAIDKIDALIAALEKMDERYVGAWQESPWLAGQLALLLEDYGRAFATDISLDDAGTWAVSYVRGIGLTVQHTK